MGIIDDRNGDARLSRRSREYRLDTVIAYQGRSVKRAIYFGLARRPTKKDPEKACSSARLWVQWSGLLLMYILVISRFEGCQVAGTHWTCRQGRAGQGRAGKAESGASP